MFPKAFDREGLAPPTLGTGQDGVMEEGNCPTNYLFQGLGCWDHLFWMGSLYGRGVLSWHLKVEENEPGRHKGKGGRTLHVTGP